MYRKIEAFKEPENFTINEENLKTYLDPIMETWATYKNDSKRVARKLKRIIFGLDHYEFNEVIKRIEDKDLIEVLHSVKTVWRWQAPKEGKNRKQRRLEAALQRRTMKLFNKLKGLGLIKDEPTKEEPQEVSHGTTDDGNA